MRRSLLADMPRKAVQAGRFIYREIAAPMRRTLLLCLALASQGCLGPPDTFGDMRDQLDSVTLPEDFTLIGKEQVGLRSRFAAAPGPTVANFYSARWEDGALCGRLRDLIATRGEVEEIGSGTCGYETTVSSGWTARLVNVWSYRLDAHAVQPHGVNRRRRAAGDCAEARLEDEAQAPGSYYGRHVPCWVDSGEALVTIMVHGKVGW